MRLIFIASITLISIQALNCGADINPPQLSFQKSPRRLSQTTDSLQPIRVHFEFIDFQFDNKQLEQLYYDVFEVLELYLENLLSVHPYTENLVFNDIEECGYQIDIPEDHKITGVEADLVVYVISYNEEDGILAQGGACILDQETYTPLSGYISVNQFETQSLEEPAEIFALLFHEITHILGFSSAQYQYFVDQNKELLEESALTQKFSRGKIRYFIQTPTVKNMTEEYFGCEGIQGMELEDYYEEPGSHWEARIMYGDYMISQQLPEPIITKITLALIQDTGYWTVNFDLGQIPVWGTDLGCDFFNRLCIEDEQPIFDEFCVKFDVVSLCDFHHFGKGQCNIKNGLDIPEEYQYFNQTMGGSLEILDYCPIVETSYNCRDEQLSTQENSVYIAEEFCQQCRCFMSDLEQDNLQTRVLRADCYRVLECLENSYTVKVESEVIKCQTQGDISVPGYSGTFECPKYEKICGERPCKDLCYAQGFCIEGQCHCNQGRGGDNCSLECHQTCYNCVGQSEFGCTSCRDGVNCVVCQVQNCSQCNFEGTECQVCKDGYGLTQNGLCEYCNIPDCLNCDNDQNSCFQCQEGLVLNDQSLCVFCQQQECQICDNDDRGFCQECEDYFSSINGNCQQCLIDHCIKCQTNLETCDQCEQGLILSYHQSECISCQAENCLICQENGVDCYICQDEYKNSNGQCNYCIQEFCEECDQEGNCIQCQKGFGFNTDNTCSPCQIDNCQDCSQQLSQCSQCQSSHQYYQAEKECRPNCSLDNCQICLDWYECQICQNGFQLMQDGKCYDCLVQNCLQCEDNNYNECQECNEYFGFDQENNCQVCSEFYCLECYQNHQECQNCRDFFMLDQENSCQPCQVWGCQNCQQDPSLCVQCIYGYQPDITNSTCVSCIIDNCYYCGQDEEDCRQCQESYFLNFQGQCEECIENCQYCLSNNSCQSCFDGYYFDGQSCQVCLIDNCKDCSVNQCNGCSDGYSLQDGECVSCEVKDCKWCDYVQVCNQCFEGFYFNSTLSMCLDCNLEGCQNCDYEPGVICEECLDGFRWTEGYICQPCNVEYCSLCQRKIDECDQCLQGLEYDQFTNTCIGCPVQGCEECNQENIFVCDQCKQGYRKEDDHCQQCSKENCAFCNENKDDCQSCIEDYILNTEGICSSCLVENCDECQSGEFNTCQSCQQGYKLDSQRTSCQLCQTEFCRNCSTDISSCQDCLQGYRLTSQNTCSSCQINNCQDCSSDQSQCNSCLDGFGFDEDQCSPCQDNDCVKCSTAYNQCEQCQQGYQPNTQGDCVDCIVDNCEFCLINNPNSCQSCISKYGLTENYQCHSCSDPNCQQCYEDPDDCEYCLSQYGLNQSGTCQKCNDENCTDCEDDYMTCYNCQNEHYQLILNSVCTLCQIDYCIQCEQTDLQNTCFQCYEGYYFDQVEQECFQCEVENCASCDDDQTKCQSCKNGYGTTDDQKCQLCPENCEICSVSDYCTECQYGYAKVVGWCQDCVVNNCDVCKTENPYFCNICSQGYIDNENGQCETGCSVQNCVNCSQGDSNSCDICQEGYFVRSDGKCAECHNDLCLTCYRGEDDDQSICDLCFKKSDTIQADAQLIDGDCACVEGSYEIQGICYQLCQLCQSCTENSCDCIQNAEFDLSNEIDDRCQCSQTYFKQDGVCVQAGFYFKRDQIEAVFNQDYNKIIVNFDEPTNEYSNNCQDLLQQQTLDLLDDPSCSWINNIQLQIILGQEIQLEFNGSGIIILNGFNIQKLEEILNTNYQILEVYVQAIHSYPVPVANVQGPDQYSISCSTKALSISGEKSEVRLTDFPEYSWSVKLQGENTPQTLSSHVRSQTTPKLQMSSQFFTVEGTYTFFLTIQNKFNSVDIDQHSVEVTNLNTLSVVISNSKPIVTAYENREFIANVKEFCGNKITPNFSWSFEGLEIGQESDLPSGINPSSLIPDGNRNNVLVLNKYQLAPGFTYLYQATATIDGVSGSTLLSIKVESSQLEADIGWTGDGEYNSNIQLELDASNSRDPDSENTQLIYSWGCVEVDENGQDQFCTGVEEEPLFDPSEEILQFLIVDSDLLKPGDVYIFKVTVQDGNAREDSDSVELTMKDAGNILVNFVSTNLKVQTSKPFLLQTYIEGEVNFVQWSQLQGSSLNLNTDSQSGFLLFQAFSLSEGEFYTFQISVSDIENNKLDIFLTVHTNLKPFCDGGFDVQEQSSLFVFQEFTQSLDQCDDGDYQDYPLKYSFGIQYRGFFRTLSYLSEANSLSIFLSPGTFTVGAKVCDSLSSCDIYTDQITSSSTRRLEDEILQSYSEANSNQDLIPFNTLIFSDYYNLTITEQDYFLDTLRLYSYSLTIVDESMASSIISATVSLLFQPFAEDNQILGCLKFLQEIIQKDIDFLLEDDIELIYLVFDEILQVNYPSENFEVLREIKSTIEAVMNNRRKNKTPNSDTEVFQSEEALSSFGIYKGQNLKDLQLTLGDEIEVFIPSLEEFEQDYMYSLLVSQFPNVGIFSDIVDISFYQHGSYIDFNLEIEIGKYKDLTNLQNVIQISFPCDISTFDIRLYQCLVFEEQEDIWKDGLCSLESIIGGKCLIHTSGTSLFQVSLIETETEISSDEECDIGITPIWMLLVLIVAGILLIITAFLRQQAQKNIKTVKNPPTKGEKNINSTRQLFSGVETKGIDNTQIFVHEKEAQKFQNRNSQNVEELKEDMDIIYQESIYYIQPLQGFQIENVEKPKIEVKTQSNTEVKTQSNKCVLFMNHHLLFGQLQFYYLSQTQKAAFLVSNLIISLGIVGILLQSIQDIQNTDNDAIGKIGKYLYISIISAVFVCLLILVFDFLIYRVKKKQVSVKISFATWVCIWICTIFAILAVILLGLEVCEEWDLLWLVLFGIAVIVELFIFETLVAIFKLAFLVSIR